MDYGFEIPLEFDQQPELADALRRVGLVEIIPEGFFLGKRAGLLRLLGELGTPVVMHSIEMSLGTDAAFRQEHFDAIRRVIDAVNCVAYSDHVCMTRAGGREIGQLTTLPFTHEAADVYCRNVDRVRRQLKGLPLMFENITNRFVVPHSTLTEPAFLNVITRRTGAGLLLDLTNAYINSVNFGFDLGRWISAIDARSIKGIHLAGGETHGGRIYDTHSQPVPSQVWDALRLVVEGSDPAAIIVEWDQAPPSVERLLDEVQAAERATQSEVV